MSIIEHSTAPRGDYAAIIGQQPVAVPRNFVAAATGTSRPALSAGERMLALAARLYPICRSLTGPGVRETLSILGEQIPLQIRSIPSGTPVLDWTVPQEWTIREAYIADEQGNRVVDFKQSNLHVVNYSEPVAAEFTWSELQAHLHTLPQHPDWIPYRTSYYQRTWGFCLSHRQWQTLAARGDSARYQVRIDATLAAGEMNYGEFYLPGESADEVLFSCHLCHPSLANDNLSGLTVAVELAQALAAQSPRRYSYRFLFLPATIGAISWLAANKQNVQHIKHGLVLTLLGDAGQLTYKRSRQGAAEIDQAVEHVLQHSTTEYEIRDFSPTGYDERQYCSPGFNLPVGCLMRTPHGEYPEYHTSADNLDFLSGSALADSRAKLLQVIDLLEQNRRYENLAPCGEPQLGRRGLYQAIGGDSRGGKIQLALLWVLNYSDGNSSLLEIAQRAKLPFEIIHRAAELLEQASLLKPCQTAEEITRDVAPLSLDELWS